ncbi:hypothetical protein OO014_05695, partial [Intrasporangium calvum]
LGSLPAQAQLGWGAETQPSGIRHGWVEEAHWWRAHAFPHMRRWVSRASAREDVAPKWAHLVRPAHDFAW